MRRLLLPVAAGWIGAGVLAIAGVAGAARPEPQYHGEYCTPAGCAGSPRSSAATALAFAVAVFASAAAARRPSASSR